MSVSNVTDRALERFERVAVRHTGLVLGAKGRDRRREALEVACRDSGHRSCDEFVAHLESHVEGRDTVERILGSVTVKETYFFRGPAQFDVLRDVVVPEIRACPSAGAGVFTRRPIHVWSAGCATGQETYSIAMALLDAVEMPGAWDIQVLGTDLSDEAVDVARAGVYSHPRLPLRAARYERMLWNGMTPVTTGTWEVATQVKAVTEFRRQNVFAGAGEMPTGMDVVFCRNVMIYFSQQRQAELIERMYAALRPGGWLFTGEAEMLHVVPHDFETIDYPGTIAYRKPGGAGVVPRHDMNRSIAG